MKVLITGASRGIGFSLAQYYGRKSYKVYGVARKSPDSWTGEKFLSCNLSNPQELEELWKFIQENGPFDVCVQNLGINKSGAFLKSKDTDLNEMAFANLTLPILLTQFLLKNKLIKEKGSFVFLNSLSHYVGYPGSSFYGGTKDGLHSFVRSMRFRFAKKYHFMSVYPGPVETDQARENSPRESNSRRMNPEVLAEKIFHGQRAKRNNLVPNFSWKTFALLGKLIPHSIESIMNKTIYLKMEKPPGPLEKREK